MKNLHVICNQPHYFSYGKPLNDNINDDSNDKFRNNNYNLTTSENGRSIMTINEKILSRDNDIVKIPLENDRLMPGAEITLPVYVYGIEPSGVHEINFIFYYEPDGIKEVPYRLVQQVIRLQTLSSLNMSLSTRSANGNVVMDQHVINCLSQK